MRADICAREDLESQSALLEALGTIGASSEDDVALEVPLPTGLLRFRAGDSVLTLFGDAWGIDLEGPDDLVRRTLAAMTTT
jgi:hypothetical protein